MKHLIAYYSEKTLAWNISRIVYIFLFCDLGQIRKWIMSMKQNRDIYGGETDEYIVVCRRNKL